MGVFIGASHGVFILAIIGVCIRAIIGVFIGVIYYRSDLFIGVIAEKGTTAWSVSDQLHTSVRMFIAIDPRALASKYRSTSALPTICKPHGG